MTTVATRSVSPASAVELYRDDGPLSRALGLAGRVVPVPPVVLPASAALALAAAIVLEGTGASKALVAAVIGWAVLAGSVSSQRPHRDRLAWLTPVVLRAVEYSGLLWLASLAGGNAVAATFALLCAVAFRQYDIVYRVRHRGVAPPAWTAAVSGGWDGRLVAGYVAWVAGVFTELFFAAGAVLAVVLVAESALGWVRAAREGRRPMHEDDDDELGENL